MREKSIKDLRDNNVRQLAQTLKASGMAASESEAVRMALDMTGTASKITENVSEKDEKAKNLSMSFVQEKTVQETVTKDSTTTTESVVQQEEVYIESEESSGHKEVEEEQVTKGFEDQDDNDLVSQGYEQSGKQPNTQSVDFNKVSVAEASGLDQTSSNTAKTPSETKKTPSKQEEHVSKQKQTPSTVEKDPDVRQTSLSEEERKKKAAKMEESKVDLADTFKFG